MPRAARFAALISGLLLSSATALAAPSWNHDVFNPPLVNPSPSDQGTNRGATMPDGAGGMFVAFTVASGGFQQIWLTRLTSTGAYFGAWANLVISASVGEGIVRLFPDGSGGVYAVWQDYRNARTDVFVQRVTGAGSVPGGWPAGGLNVSGGTVEHATFSACPDTTGGLFVVYDYLFGAGDVDLYAAHVAGNGTFTTATINANGNIQQHPAISADGAGGFYVAFEDKTSGNFDIKASRFNAGMVAYFTNKIIADPNDDQQFPQIVTTGIGAYVYWVDCRFGTYCQVLYDYVTSSGNVGYDFGFSLYNNPNHSQAQLSLFPDNTGGYYVAWVEDRAPNVGLYLKHFLQSSTPYSGWPAGGVFVAPGFVDQTWEVGLATDSNNGALITWADGTTTGALLGAHYDAFGNAKPLTNSGGGRLLVQDGVAPFGVTLIPDTKNGAFATFEDFHLGHGQLCAQHIDPYMVLGDASPVSAGIKDIKADQGGHVRVTWNPSWFDNSIDYGIGSYWVWRQAPITLAEAAKRSGSSALFRPASAPGANYAWEFLAQQPANQSAQYSYVAPTTTDSITGHNPYTVFMVEAHASEDSRAFWQSAPDSGYSVDNLAPSTPAPFLGTYAAGNTSMNWGPNGESDLYGYRLYRGTTVGFTPNPGNRIATVSSTAYLDPAVPPSIYKLTAVDVHGNESLPATLVPSGVTGVDPDLPRELSFALASANPSRGEASFRLALPRATGVTLAIYDIGGRQVRVVSDGAWPAGVHTLAWNGRGASGEPAPSGIYLARLRAENREFVRRIVLAR